MIDEEARLRELERYDVLGDEPEPALDRLVELVALVCNAPMALISFIDPRRQAVVAGYGIALDSVARDQSLCAHTLGRRDLLVLEDAQADPRFADHALVVGAPHVRFYAGASLRTPSGHALGAVCAMDRAPRPLDPGAGRGLLLLRDQIMQALDARRELVELRRSEALRQEAVEALVVSTRDLERRIAIRTREVEEAHARTRLSEQRLVEAQAVAHIGSWEWSTVTNRVVWSAEMYRIYGVDPAHFDDRYEGFLSHVFVDDLEHTRKTIEGAFAKPQPFVYDHRIVRSDGDVRMLHTRGDVITDELGAPVRMIGSCWDVTDLWQADENFERIIALLRTGMDVMLNGLLLVADAAHRIFCNAVLLGLAGIDPKEPAAEDPVALLDRMAAQLRDGDRLRVAVARLQADPSVRIDETFEHRDGRLLRCQGRACRRGDELVGRIWVFRLPT
jgi:PAS domain-containing protein